MTSSPQEVDDVKYALLIYERPGAYDPLSEEDRRAVNGEYVAISQDERVTGGAQLQPADTATTVRVADGRALTTDGPFAETEEVFGATTCSRPTTSTPRWSWRRRFRQRAWAARSRCARSWARNSRSCPEVQK